MEIVLVLSTNLVGAINEVRGSIRRRLTVGIIIRVEGRRLRLQSIIYRQRRGTVHKDSDCSRYGHRMSYC